MTRKPRPLAALANGRLDRRGCSNGSAENGTGAGSSGGNTNATNRDKAVTFSECMRDNGWRTFRTPRMGP